MACLQSGPLAELLEALGVQVAHVRHENAKMFTIDPDVEPASVEAFTFTIANRFKDAYGEATEVAEISFGALPVIDILSDDLSEEYIERGKSELGAGQQCRLKISINKERLVQEVLGHDAQGNVFFFFASLAERYISNEFIEFEEAVWGEATEYRRMIIGDLDVRRTGEAFELIGTESLPGALDPVPHLSPSIVENMSKMREGRSINVAWEHSWVQHLTPVQIELGGKSQGTNLEAFFSALHVQLCMLYLCDRARRRLIKSGHPEIQAEFGDLKILIPERNPIAPTISVEANQGFAKLVNWCYELRDADSGYTWAADRLKLVRVRMTIELERYPEGDRMRLLLGAIRQIWDSMESHWRAFIEDRLSKYIDEEHKLESIAADAVRNAGEKSVALAKSLSDTMLAAVAAVIGAAIAAAFRATFDEDLFKVLVLSYAGYILLFPGFYGLMSQVSQYKGLKKSFEKDKARFVDLLGEPRVRNVVGGRDRDANSTYWRTFWWTFSGFVVAVAAAVALAFIVPAVVC